MMESIKSESPPPKALGAFLSRPIPLPFESPRCSQETTSPSHLNPSSDTDPVPHAHPPPSAGSKLYFSQSPTSLRAEKETVGRREGDCEMNSKRISNESKAVTTSGYDNRLNGRDRFNKEENNLQDSQNSVIPIVHGAYDEERNHEHREQYAHKDQTQNLGVSNSLNGSINSFEYLSSPATQPVTLPDRFVCEPKIVETIIERTKVLYEEKIVKVPQTVYKEKIVEIPNYINMEKIIHVPKINYVERLVEVPRYETIEKIIEIPNIRFTDKYVEVPQIIRQEKIVPIKKIQNKERVIHIPKIEYRDKIIEKSVVEYKEIPIEKIVEIPEYRTEYIYKDIPVPQKVYREVPVDKIVDVPYEEVVEKVVRRIIPQYKEVVKVVEVPKPQERHIPCQKIIPRQVVIPQPVDTIEEVEVPKYITKVVERPYKVTEVQTIKEQFPVEVTLERVVEHVNEIPRQVKVEREIPVPRSQMPLIQTREGLIPLDHFATRYNIDSKSENQTGRFISQDMATLLETNIRDTENRRDGGDGVRLGGGMNRSHLKNTPSTQSPDKSGRNTFELPSVPHSPYPRQVNPSFTFNGAAQFSPFPLRPPLPRHAMLIAPAKNDSFQCPGRAAPPTPFVNTPPPAYISNIKTPPIPPPFNPPLPLHSSPHNSEGRGGNGGFIVSAPINLSYNPPQNFNPMIMTGHMNAKIGSREMVMVGSQSFTPPPEYVPSLNRSTGGFN